MAALIPQLERLTAGEYDQAMLSVEAAIPANKAWLT